MRSAELVKIAAAKRKEKENDRQIYSSSNGVHARDELRVLFAGKCVRQQRSFESVKQKQQTSTQKEEKDEDIIPDYKRISKYTISEFESQNALTNTDTASEHVQDKTPEIRHPKIQINDEESYELGNGDKELVLDNVDNMNNEKSLLVALSISLESDLPAEFYEKLFRESQVQNLMENSDSFRSGVEILCKMYITS